MQKHIRVPSGYRFSLRRSVSQDQRRGHSVKEFHHLRHSISSQNVVGMCNHSQRRFLITMSPLLQPFDQCQRKFNSPQTCNTAIYSFRSSSQVTITHNPPQTYESIVHKHRSWYGGNDCNQRITKLQDHDSFGPSAYHYLRPDLVPIYRAPLRLHFKYPLPNLNAIIQSNPSPSPRHTTSLEIAPLPAFQKYPLNRP